MNVPERVPAFVTSWLIDENDDPVAVCCASMSLTEEDNLVDTSLQVLHVDAVTCS